MRYVYFSNLLEEGIILNQECTIWKHHMNDQLHFDVNIYDRLLIPNRYPHHLISKHNFEELRDADLLNEWRTFYGFNQLILWRE